MTKRIMAAAIALVAVSLVAAITTDLSAQPLQPQQTVTPAGGTDAPPTAPAQGGLIWFDNQAEFEAFNACAGNVLKGIENYEESILDLNSTFFFDDPLESGVPNLPGGFPFPDGMTGLPNLRVQSNLGGGDPTDENPRGPDGLLAVSAGDSGAISDLVVAGTQGDSLDLIFTDEKSGVGFNTIIFVGGPSVEVRVYSTTNGFLGMMTTPANSVGTNFIGVWSPDPIGRINIFDPRSGAEGLGFEGGDNIQAWEVPCPSDFDGDGNVGASDLLTLLVNWGPCP
ncbi:MAG: hypothetical protein V3T84_12045 [Phycisphaerales bacterium]